MDLSVRPTHECGPGNVDTDGSPRPVVWEMLLPSVSCVEVHGQVLSSSVSEKYVNSD